MAILKKYHCYLFICFILGGLFGLPHQVLAATNTNFSVTPVFSEAQTDTTLDYFNLVVAPDQHYPLTVTVENTSRTKVMTFDAKLVAATTSSQGKIDYTPSTTKNATNGSMLLPNLAANQKTHQKITLNPLAKGQVTFEIQIPNSGLQGTVLGSVFVQQHTTQQQDKSTVGIQNQFAITTPVILKPVNSAKLMPNLEMNQVHFKQINNTGQITADIVNKAPVMFGKIQLTADLYQKGVKKARFTKHAENLEMAPNSTLAYPFTIPIQKLNAGQYTLKVTLSSGPKTFHLKQTFTIKASQLKKNTATTSKKPRYLLFWIIASVIVLCLIFVILLALIKRYRSKIHRSTH